MNKKTLLSILLGGAVLIGGIGISFADDIQEQNIFRPNAGNGFRMHSQYSSVEEVKEAKLNAIDQMVEDGRLTSEQAEEYKALINERMDDCSSIGENRDKNERFGRGQGFHRGHGPKKGFGFRFNQQ